jgi:hypothetical protein
VLVAYYNQYQARRQKREDNFFSALNWLTGGTQTRNVGIAAVEFFAREAKDPEDHTERLGRIIRGRVFGAEYDALKDQTERFRSLSIDALSSAAMYLLLQSSQGLAPHEANNLRRIMKFLLNVKPEEAEKHALQYEDLHSALGEAWERRHEDLSTALGAPKPPAERWDWEHTTRKNFLSIARKWDESCWKHRGLWVEPSRLEQWQKDLPQPGNSRVSTGAVRTSS